MPLCGWFLKDGVPYHDNCGFIWLFYDTKRYIMTARPLLWLAEQMDRLWYINDTVWQRQFTNQDGSLEVLSPVCVSWVYIITCDVLPWLYPTFCTWQDGRCHFCTVGGTGDATFIFIFISSPSLLVVFLLVVHRWKSKIGSNSLKSLSREKTLTKALLYLKLTMALK